MPTTDISPTTPIYNHSDNLVHNLEPHPQKQPISWQKILITAFTSLLSITLGLIGGYLIHALIPAQEAVSTDVSTETQDVGERLFAHYGKERLAGEGSLKISTYLDSNRNGIRDESESGISGVSIQLRRLNADIPFINQETDGEGISLITGLQDDSYEITLNYYPHYSASFGDLYYPANYILTSNPLSATGLLPMDYTLVDDISTGRNLDFGIIEYIPNTLIAMQDKDFSLYSPENNALYLRSTFGSSESLPPNFQVRDNSLIYAKNGNLFRLNPWNKYSETIYKDAPADAAQYLLSASGNSLLYRLGSDTYLRTYDNTCGLTSIRYNNQPTYLQTQSSPFNYVSADFLDDNHLVFVGSDGNNLAYFQATCQAGEVVTKKLDIDSSTATLKPPIYLDSNTILLSKYGNYQLYHLNDDTLRPFLEDNYRQYVPTKLSNSLLFLANYSTNEALILNYKTNTLYTLDKNRLTLADSIASYFSNSNNYLAISDTELLYLDLRKDCTQDNNHCLTIRSFKLSSGQVSEINPLTTINNYNPYRIIGRLSK